MGDANAIEACFWCRNNRDKVHAGRGHVTCTACLLTEADRDLAAARARVAELEAERDAARAALVVCNRVLKYMADLARRIRETAAAHFSDENWRDAGAPSQETTINEAHALAQMMDLVMRRDSPSLVQQAAERWEAMEAVVAESMAFTTMGTAAQGLRDALDRLDALEKP